METITKLKSPKLTKKQRGFVKDYALDENGTKAVMNNYNVKDSIVAKSIASENLTKPYIQEALEIEQLTLKSALKKQGVTPEKIALKIDQLLDSDDDASVDKGLKHATNIYGVEDLDQKPKTNTTYNFIFNSEAQAEIKTMEAKIKERLINVQTPETPISTN